MDYYDALLSVSRRQISPAGRERNKYKSFRGTGKAEVTILHWFDMKGLAE